MPMDVDAIVAGQYIDKLRKIMSDQPHGKREKICDDIINFVDKMEKKYEIL